MKKTLLLVFLFPFISFAQVQPMKETYLMLNSKYTAHVILDGDTIGTALASKFSRFPAIPGDHVLSIIARDTALKWENRIFIKGGEQNIIDFTLTPYENTYGIAGSYVDPADQHVYKTTKIKNLEWFAENYALKTSNIRMPGNQPANVASLGYLYRYIDIVAPPGWRIPTEADFRSLMNAYLDTFTQLSAGGISGFNFNYPGYANSGGKIGFGNEVNYWSSTKYQQGKETGVRTFHTYKGSKSVDIFRCGLLFNNRGIKDNQHYMSVRFVRDIK